MNKLIYFLILFFNFLVANKVFRPFYDSLPSLVRLEDRICFLIFFHHITELKDVRKVCFKKGFRRLS